MNEFWRKISVIIPKRIIRIKNSKKSVMYKIIIIIKFYHSGFTPRVLLRCVQGVHTSVRGANMMFACRHRTGCSNKAGQIPESHRLIL